MLINGHRPNSFTTALGGARLGLSDHTDDNHKAFDFDLAEQDLEDINSILLRSNSRDMIHTIGDCGAEYR